MVKNSCLGQSLVELVISLSIIAIVFAFSWQIVNLSYESIMRETTGVQAHYLVIEGLEVIRSMRDENWNALIDGVWHFEYSESDPENKVLVLIEGSEKVFDKFTRSIKIYSVRRDENGEITDEESYPVDQNTKLIEVNVEWYDFGKVRVDSEKIYLTNWESS